MKRFGLALVALLAICPVARAEGAPLPLYGIACGVNEKGIYQTVDTLTTRDKLILYREHGHANIVPPFKVDGVILRQHWGPRGQAIFWNDCLGTPL